MIDITSFLLKHLYEFMADNYNATQQRHREQQQDQSEPSQPQQQQAAETKPEQETNQQIVSFLINNQLPDLACETLIELIFICVFLAVSWIFVMIIQLHCHQTVSQSLMDLNDGAPSHSIHSHSASSSPSSAYSKDTYCNTKFLNSLMYCNNHISLKACSS